ncbi:proline-rich protein 2-like [Vulpes lagopus]|uniref:proline-rich protein 2-like n=1 Tax=Vulpes lagopus TaxID=494514 RepID=UPI001BCA5620|nr:proline-rich protein 2-like [Vulpes lagopus]
MLVYSFNLVFLSYIYVWGTQERQLLSETQECWSLPGFSAPLAFWSQDASESAGRHHRVTCGGSRGAADPAVAPQPVDPGSPRHGDRSQQQTRPWAGNTHTAGSLAADSAGLASRGGHGPGVTARPAPAASTFLPQAAPEGAGRSPGGRPPPGCLVAADRPRARPLRPNQGGGGGGARGASEPQGRPPRQQLPRLPAPPRASPRLPAPPRASWPQRRPESCARAPHCPPLQRLSRGSLRATFRISPNVRPRSLPPKPLIPRRRSPARPRPEPRTSCPSGPGPLVSPDLRSLPPVLCSRSSPLSSRPALTPAPRRPHPPRPPQPPQPAAGLRGLPSPAVLPPPLGPAASQTYSRVGGRGPRRRGRPSRRGRAARALRSCGRAGNRLSPTQPGSARAAAEAAERLHTCSVSGPACADATNSRSAGGGGRARRAAAASRRLPRGQPGKEADDAPPKIAPAAPAPAPAYSAPPRAARRRRRRPEPRTLLAAGRALQALGETQPSQPPQRVPPETQESGPKAPPQLSCSRLLGEK